MTEKRCFKCREKKDLADFYRHAMMADGHLNKCKACTRLDVLAHRSTHIEHVRAYDRQRASHPHRVELRQRIARAWTARHPDRKRATTQVNNAVRDGRLQRATACQVCQTPGRVEAHHHDYTQPLDVLWVCKPCHWHADDVRRLQEAVAHGI